MDSTEPDPLDVLEADLNTWRKTPFDRLLTRRDSVPALHEVARQGRHDDKVVELEEVWKFLVAVVAAAGDSEIVGAPTDNLAVATNPAVVQEIFGLTNRSKDADVEDRQRHAAEATGGSVSWHTVRKPENRKALVQQLATWVRNYLEDRSASADVSSGVERTGPVIRRDEDLAWLRATYDDLNDHGGGLFGVWGIAGIGKTTLVQQFADQVGPAHVTGIIRIVDERVGVTARDLRRVLQQEGHDDSAWSDDYCWAKFGVVARQLRRVRLLIADGVEDPSQLTALIPHGSNVPVLTTSRERLLVVQSPGAPGQPALRLRTFTRAQARECLQNRLPTLDPDLTTQFAEVVSGHPESLAYIAHYLALDDAVSAEELLEDLYRRPRQALIDLAEEIGVPVGTTVAIEKLLTKVERSTLAYAILLCLVWSHDWGQLPRTFVLEQAEILRGEYPSRLEVRGALRHLEYLGLVGQDSDYLRMSRMACQVVRDLTIPDFEPVIVAYERLIAAPPSGTASALLKLMREEYVHVVVRLQDAVAGPVGSTSVALPALFPLDERHWIYLNTDTGGQRHGSIYRLTPGSIQCLDAPSARWVTITGTDESRVFSDVVQQYHDLAYKYYNSLRAARGLPSIPKETSEEELARLGEKYNRF